MCGEVSRQLCTLNNIMDVMQFVVLQECVKDTMSPIIINLNFSQVNSEISQAALNVDSRRQLLIEVGKVRKLKSVTLLIFHYVT